MKKKRIIQKILRLTAWLLVGSGMITLLAAANKRQGDHECKEVLVSIKGSGEKFYVERHDIIGQLKASVNGSLIGRPTISMNLSKMERALRNNAWIQDAQLYFDGRDILHVVVTEREPIARVFTIAGGSFYLDSAGKRMPLLDKVSVRLPVVTNFTAAKKFNAKDSAVTKDLTALLQFINSNTFWHAQIAQIDVQSNATFELIPLVGNHIIRIGEASNLEEKFQNLYLFYKKVLSKAGFDTYKIIDVRFKGQVLGVKTNPTASIDSLQLQKNIEALIEKTKAQAANDSLFSANVNELLLKKDTSSVRLDSIVINPTPEKTETVPDVKQKGRTVSSPKSNPKEQPKKEQKSVKQPKAVMQKVKKADRKIH